MSDQLGPQITMWDDLPPVLLRCVDPLSVGPRADTMLYSLDVPSEKLLIASFEGDSATYLSVTLGSPSLIIRCTMISALNTIVHVESRKRFCRVRNISATPASPAWVAMRICSTYLALGGASCSHAVSAMILQELFVTRLDLCATFDRLLERT